MINPSELESQLESYGLLFVSYRPSNENSLSHHLFQRVAEIIQKQIILISNMNELESEIKDIDKFIRKLKVEYGHVHNNLNELEYPRFITKLKALKVGHLIVDYHSSIIHLLMLLLYIFSQSDDREGVASELAVLLNKFINNFQPEEPKLKKFHDILKFEINSSDKLLKKIKQRHLDIVFDEDY